MAETGRLPRTVAAALRRALVEARSAPDWGPEREVWATAATSVARAFDAAGAAGEWRAQNAAWDRLRPLLEALGLGLEPGAGAGGGGEHAGGGSDGRNGGRDAGVGGLERELAELLGSGPSAGDAADS